MKVLWWRNMNIRLRDKLVVTLLLQLVFLSRMALAQWVDANPVKEVEKTDDGAILTLNSGYLRFQVCSESILHVVYSMEPKVSPRVDFTVVKKSWQRAEIF